MSDSEKNDELDNYGVWVKKGPQTVDSSAAGDTDFSMDMNLPDFSDLDVPDETASESTVDVTDSFLSDLDTDLSDITGDASPSPAEASSSAESSGETEDISLDEFITGGEFEDVAEGNRGYGQAETPAPAQEATSSGEESVSLDDFLDGDSFEAAPAEAATAEVTQDEAPLDIDLSFDDSADSLATVSDDTDSFISEEPVAESPASSLDGTESIDLSEFGFDDSAEESAPAEAAVATEEAPAESVTESSGGDSFDEMFNSISEDSAIDASAFFDEPADEAPAEAPAPSTPSADTSSGEEEVDLSDFGFDDSSLASQGEVKDDTKPASAGTVDYEMNVMADDDLPPQAPAAETAIASEEMPVIEEAQQPVIEETAISEDMPVVEEMTVSEEMPVIEEPEQPVIEETAISAEELANLNSNPIEETSLEMPSFEEAVPADAEIESAAQTPVLDNAIIQESPAETEALPEDNLPQAETQPQEQTAQTAPSAQDGLASSAATAILSQIVGELSSLKNEIAGLKNDFEEMKNRDTIPSPVTEEQTEEKSGGFFDDNGEDDTIALSTDELANIMNTADFETEEAEENADAPAEEAQTVETSAEESEAVSESEIAFENAENVTDSAEPAISESSDDNDFVMPEPEAPAEDNALDGDETLSTDELANIMNTADFAHEQAEDQASEETLEAPAPEASSADALVTEENADDQPVIFEDAVTELPENESAESADDNDFVMPEPEAPAEDNALDGDETLSTDELANIMNTADFAHEQAEEAVEDVAVEEPVTEEAAIEEAVSEENTADDFNFDAIESGEEPVPEEISVPKVEEPVETPVSFAMEETPAEGPEAPVFAEEPAFAETAAPASNENALSGDLKTEIKSVLSYMDKLLENLPEDKIAEFAQSEQFETYKKLFKELGLA